MHYEELAKRMLEATDTQIIEEYPLNARLYFPALLAKTLAAKCNIREKCVSAYQSSKPRQALLQVLDTELNPLRESMNELWRFYRDVIWLSTMRPAGLEIVEMRFAAVRSRLDTMHDRISAYCTKHDPESIQEPSVMPKPRVKCLPEFEADLRVPVYEGYGMDLTIDFARAYTPSRNLGTG